MFAGLMGYRRRRTIPSDGRPRSLVGVPLDPPRSAETSHSMRPPPIRRRAPIALGALDQRTLPVGSASYVNTAYGQDCY